MAIVRVPDRFVARRGLAASAAALNEVLLDGEFFLEKDTRRIKQGDGVTAYNSLPYAVAGPFDVTGLADGDTWIWDSGAGMSVPGVPEIDVNNLVGFPGGTSEFLRSDGVFAPAGGGGGGAAAGYAVHRVKAAGFRATQDYGGTPTAVAATANRIYAQPFTVDRQITLTGLSAENSTINAGAGLKFRVGVYDNDNSGAYDQPGGLLADSGDLGVASAGVKVGAVSIVLDPGAIYWSALLCNVSVSFRCYPFTEFPIQWFGRGTTTTNNPNNHHLYPVTAGWTALPATWPGLSTVASSNCPCVFLVE